MIQFSAGTQDNGTMGWLIEFGLISKNSRTEKAKKIKVPAYPTKEKFNLFISV